MPRRLSPSSPERVAEREQHALEAWKRMVHEARTRDVILHRTDERDGDVQFFTFHRGGLLVHHETETQLRSYLRGCS
jgi:hypothetical protein